MNDFERRMGQKRQHPAEMLKGVLASQSEGINTTVEKEHGLTELLKPDGALDPAGYSELYTEAELKQDAHVVRESEITFSALRHPNVLAAYKKDGLEDEDEILAKWRQVRSEQKSAQMEMAVTALLSEMLGKDFLVVRTATYDDYINGVDNLILDRITGEVVGAFDEVHEGGDGSRTEEKKIKLQKIAKRGGAKIRYGLKFSNGELTRASLEGVPVFYLGLESSELMELIQGLKDNDPEKKEKIFQKLLTSLAAQHGELQKSVQNMVPLRGRLASFGKSLSRIMNTTQQQKAA